MLDTGFWMLDIPKNQNSLNSLFFEDPRSRGPGIGTGYWFLVLVLYSLFFILYSLFFILYSLFFIPCSLFLVPCSLFLVPCYWFLVLCSLFLVTGY